MISPRNRFIIYIIVGIMIAVLWWVSKPESLPVLGEIPEFSMIDTNHESFGADDLRGKIWVADFIFTTCAGPCPIMSTAMLELHNEFIDDQDVRTVSFTVNPDYDTPDVLAEYAERYEANTEQWHFLHAPYEDIQAIISNGFKMGDIEEIVFHSTYFSLVDKNMHIRGYYTGTDANDVQELIRDIHNLIRES